MKNHSVREELVNPRRGLAAILIGGFAALAVLYAAFKPDTTNFESAAALGAETTSILAKFENYPIHCMDSRDAALCLAGRAARRSTRVVLWLGNSQLHEVNQWQKGQTNATPILFEQLRGHKLDLLTFSQPNASLQEHYVLFEYLRQRLPLKVLILPVFLDDMREEGLRNEIAELARDPSTAERLDRTDLGKRLVAASRVTPVADDLSGITNTVQERVESQLNSWLSTNSYLWQIRPEIRGQILVGLYKLRNSIFGITPSTKRRMIPGRYRDNWSALTEILNGATSSGIQVVLYVPPVRSNDREIPYDAKEYATFKSELAALANKFAVEYDNLEDLIPAPLWGTKESTNLDQKQELDFMHFRFGGHQLIASKLIELVLHANQKNRGGE